MEETRYLYSELIPRLATEPSLSSIPPRLFRAAAQYSDLVRAFDAMTAAIYAGGPEVSAGLADMANPEPALTFKADEAFTWPPPTELPLLVSEILHNLRSAADHLIYNVAWMDSGREQKRTQFPIFGTAADFRTKGRKMLPGVNALHQSWIESIQPYNKVSWSGSLAHLSNNDKHNYLHEVVPTLRYRIDLHAGTPSTADSQRVLFPIDNLEARLRLIRRDQDPADLDIVLSEIIGGMAALINRFLREAGISQMHVDFIKAARPPN